MQDLIFAAQSRRTIERWQAAYTDRRDIAITLVRLAYTQQDNEIAGRTLDFSGPTVQQRRSAGRNAGEAVVGRVDVGTLMIGARGLNVIEI